MQINMANNGNWAVSREVLSFHCSNFRLIGLTNGHNREYRFQKICASVPPLAECSLVLMNSKLCDNGNRLLQISLLSLHCLWVSQRVLFWQGLKSPQESMADLSPVENLRIPSKVNFWAAVIGAFGLQTVPWPIKVNLIWLQNNTCWWQ